MSSWIILDAATGRPVKPETYLAGRLPVQEHVVEQDFSRLSPLEEDESTFITPWATVPPMALDRNLHVNNTRYLEYSLLTRPDLMRADMRIRDRDRDPETVDPKTAWSILIYPS